VEPNILKIGDYDAYLNDVITMNIAIASTAETDMI
jgi:hypothetical protein